MKKDKATRTICIYLTDAEKARLDAAAAEEHTSVSGLIKGALSGYIGGEKKLKVAAQELYDDGEDHSADQRIKRPKRIKVSFSDEEYAAVKKAAGARTLSSYIRYTLFNATAGISFDVPAGDLDELNRRMSDISMHMTGFIAGLKFLDAINPDDVEYMKKLLEETNKEVKSLNAEIRKNRYSIRQQGRRYLEKRINTLLDAKGKVVE